MKDISNIKRFSLFIFTLLIFISCQKKEPSLSRNLLLEQSKDLTLANHREISGLLSKIAEENLEEKKQTSPEYEQILKLYDEFGKFELNIQNAERAEIVDMIDLQNIRFKNDEAFKAKYFKFKPMKVEEFNQLDDEVFKFYALSKITRFYVDAAGYIFVKREHKYRAEL
ncbi:hypothetical protein [Flavobacterium sp. 3HN19-14]|uniref:hypothetical protein n=1 Tax=Flavobacterium sp. 3HN19-14 TaxID=3448133 RepID=UPI003EE2502F